MRHVLFLMATAMFLSYFVSGQLGHAAAAEFHVAADGDDANPGTEAQPFATVGKAREAVRPLIAAGLAADVTVWIGEGTYRLAEPLTFGPEDSGTSQFAVTYRAKEGQRVTFSGGRTITGWQRGAGELWVATVPGVQDGWTFRNLFVDGRRAIRARTPNHDAEPNCFRLMAVEPVDKKTRFLLTVEPDVLGD